MKTISHLEGEDLTVLGNLREVQDSFPNGGTAPTAQAHKPAVKQQPDKYIWLKQNKSIQDST